MCGETVTSLPVTALVVTSLPVTALVVTSLVVRMCVTLLGVCDFCSTLLAGGITSVGADRNYPTKADLLPPISH